MTFKERLEEFVYNESTNFKYRVGDKIRIDFDVSPTIAYNYLFFEDGHEHSFHNEELNRMSSEEHPNKSDYAIYFERIKSFCSRTLNESLNKSGYKEHIHLTSPNRRISEILTKIFGKSLKPEDWPPIMQLSLYTNQNGDKSPRVFCAIGNHAVIYILFYDPYHKICSSK